jgi:hypothetical protein
MDEREGFDAQQEAKREVAGKVDRSTRERMWSGLTKYLAAEAQHARKAAGAEKKKDQDRRSR